LEGDKLANEKHIDILKKGSEFWNEWRIKNPEIQPDLSKIKFFSEMKSEKDDYFSTTIENYDFHNCEMRQASLRDATFINCIFDNVYMHSSDLVGAYFQSCSFSNTGMRVSKIGSAKFLNCKFSYSDLSYCSAEETSFENSELINTRFENVSFVNCDFSNAIIDSCSVFGISSWDLCLADTVQKNIIITRDDQPIISVDNLELAQFIYMLISNKRLRDIIDTITSKVVLILGNFSTERKKVLDEIREALRSYDLIPVIFDFVKPESRNISETVFTLAHISKFVIADISSPRSIPQELSTIIPRLSSVNFYPIIIENEREYGMFNDFDVYPWVKPIRKYKMNEHLRILNEIIEEEKNRV